MWSRAQLPDPLVPPTLLDFWVKHHLNVLLYGAHGVGKTSMVHTAFQRAGYRVLTFSGATMDPWVDFVGVPRPVESQPGKFHLELVCRPELADDQIDAIFIDEFNRAPAKVRNAAMELLQFKSVNGRRLNRLKCVWAAINPAESHAYDVEALDPAQADRFHVHYEVPFKPCPQHFIGNFGSLGRAALEWWDGLPEKHRPEMSPRRLEMAIRMYQDGGDLRHVLPKSLNPRELKNLFQQGPLFDRLRDCQKSGDLDQARALILNPAEGAEAIRLVLRSPAACVFFLPLLPMEKLASLLTNQKVLEVVVKFSESIPEFHDVVQMVLIGDDPGLVSRVQALAKKHNVPMSQCSQMELLGQPKEILEDDLKQIDPNYRMVA